MCKIVNVKINGKTIQVAEIKKKYIQNIVDAAEECDMIDKIIIFGSCIRPDCKEDSDIDVAVFGSLTRVKGMTSAKYRRFADRLAMYDDFNQSYDLLYFKSDENYKEAIMDEIEKGEVLYVRSK